MAKTSARMRAIRPSGRWHLDDYYRVLDYSCRVRVDHQAAGRVMSGLLAPFRASKSRDARSYALVGRNGDGYHAYLDGNQVQRGKNLPPILDYLLWHVNSEAIKGVQDRLLIHASAASWKGKGLVMPAPPDHGKTTTVAGLVRAGFDYLTDEATVIDPATGLLHPFPRSLWIDFDSEALPGLKEQLPKSSVRLMSRYLHVRPKDLRTGSIAEPCPLRYVVAPNYAEGSKTTLEPISRAEAVVVLAKNSFNFKSFGRRGFELLSRVVEGADCYRLSIGNLDAAVKTLRKLVGAGR